MAEKNNATCSICGTGYYKCLSCKDKISAEPWRTRTCSPEHYKVSQVVRGFNTGVYTKEEAKERLNLIDLSDINDFRDSIKNSIKEIIKEDKKVSYNTFKQKKIETEVVEKVVEEKATEEPVEEKTIDVVVEEKIESETDVDEKELSFANRKKRYSE